MLLLCWSCDGMASEMRFLVCLVCSCILVSAQICALLPLLGFRIVSEAQRMAESDVQEPPPPPLRIVLSDDCFIVRSLFVFIYSIYFFAQRWVGPFFLRRRQSTSRLCVELMLMLSSEHLLCVTHTNPNAHRRNGGETCASDKTKATENSWINLIEWNLCIVSGFGRMIYIQMKWMQLINGIFRLPHFVSHCTCVPVAPVLEQARAHIHTQLKFKCE